MRVTGEGGGRAPAAGRDRRRFWVRVPGSTSNLGPGFDAVGMAVDAFLEATWEAAPGPGRVTRSGTLEDLPGGDEDDLVLQTLHQAKLHNLLKHNERQARYGDQKEIPPGRLHLHSDIPIGQGLGSSAAARIAGAVLRRLLTVGTADREEVLREAAIGEGHPDNAAPAVLGGLVAASLDEADGVVAVPLPVSLRLGWVYASPGVKLATERARAALPREVPLAAAARNAGRLALLIPALAAGDGPLLGRAMEDELHVPYRLPLIPGAAEAVLAGKEAGAWAVTLSGAGSGLLAAVPRGSEDRVGEAMAQAFRAHPDAGGGDWRALRPWTPGAQWGPGPLRSRDPERFATPPA